MKYTIHAVLLWTLSFLLLSQLITAQTTPPPQPKTNGSSSPKFNLKMAVVMVVLVVAFFILGFLSVYTRQCAQTRLQGRVDLALRNGSLMARGLDPAVIETFPAFIYSDVKALKLGQGALECAVCLQEFQDHETLRLIPKCDHVFHPDCIDTWLLSHSTCPVCRAYLVPKPGEEPYAWVDPNEEDIESGQSDTAPCRAEASPPSLPSHMPPRQVSVRIVEDQIKEEESPSPAPPVFINLVNGSEAYNQRGPPRSRSTGFGPPRSRSTGLRFTRVLFPRSHSTGHSLVKPGENVEKFTLRLPNEVRAQLVNSALIRSRSNNVAFPRAGSVRKDIRSESGRGKSPGLFERFDPSSRSNRSGRSGRWAFSMLPPFVSRNGSVRNQSGDNDVATQSAAEPSELISAPLDHIGGDERSTDTLRPKDQV
ncbi:hypothetical protein C1H46_001730 [Malus baccata]|uniref:RING-type E3 ubiquitin transferase n=1 Tax=Malus baccata TaxID=106549 RepID=A0A540NQ99_MALBA|nr:hypothetical protein C1H46_001730 [Malus baccata]